MSLQFEHWPYPTVIVDGVASTDVDGENQVCECGNDSLSRDWCAADADGRLSADAAGSSDPAEHAVCPVCGRVYLNEGLFSGRPTFSIVRYDTGSREFIAAWRTYHREAYGGPSSP